jgi:nitrate/nitrite transporter NarK
MTNISIVFLTYSIPFGSSLSIVATLSVITQREYFSKYLGFAVGVRYSANSIGAVVVSFILPIIFAALGYKMTFVSLLVFAPIILCYGFVGRHHVHQDTESTERSGKSVINLYKEFLQDKSFTISLVAIAMYFFTCYIPIVFMVSLKIVFLLFLPLSPGKTPTRISISSIPACSILAPILCVSLHLGTISKRI